MRPYFAIIQDSFREAFASRTLQVMLALITVLLLGLAIPGLRIDRPAELSVEDVQNPDGLARKLGRTSGSGMSDALLSLRKRLSPTLQERFVAYRSDRSDENRDASVSGLVGELNTLLDQESLYEAEAWEEVSLTAEGRKLLSEPWEELSVDERRRLNRLLIDGAFGGYLQEADDSEAFVTYVVDEAKLPMPVEQAHGLVQAIVYGLLKWFVGAAGMLAAIIFTASMIPQMFEPGAIDLLLSKPVSRSGAFLAKFAGGCVFIVINGSLFVVGLWLILGLRHGDWNARLLLAIPVFLLAFTIYFSVSAHIGVRWRNPILAIALTLVTWAGTFLLHQVWYWGQQFYLNGLRAEVLVAAETTPLVARKNGEVLRWNNGAWRRVFTETVDDPGVAMQRGTGLFNPLLGPVLVDIESDMRLVAVERNFRPPMFSVVGDIIVGREANDWSRERGPTAPSDAFSIHATETNEVLLICRSGVRRIDFPPLGGEREEEVQLTELGPDDARWQEPVDAAFDPRSGDIAVFSRGRVVMLQRAGDQYSVRQEFETEDASPALVGLTRDDVVLARENGTLHRLDRQTLQPREGSFPLPTAPKRMVSAPDGSELLVVDHERRLHRLEANRSLALADVRGQRDVTAAAFDPDGRLFVADRLPRVTAYDRSRSVVESWESNEGFAWAYLWIIDPLHTVLPIPDELDLLVREAVGANESEQGPGGDDLTREREYVDVWTPVWSSALFVIVVLAVTCWVIERRDY